MKKLTTLFVLILTTFSVAFSQDAKMDRFVNDLMKKMTIDEKIGQLNLITLGYGVVTGAATADSPLEKIKSGKVGAVLNSSGPENLRKAQEAAVNNTRLKIPIFFGMDVIHGHKTVFPIPLAISCTWDIPMVEKSARIAATEASADGLNWVYSPMVDITRDPRWGRVAEGSGEDAYLGSLIAAAMVRGHQGPGLSDSSAVMSCVKHFALYGAAEGGRDYNTVDMSSIRMYQEYLPPYKAAIEAGAGSIMTSFNDINGIPATANRWLLTDLLRKEWGFKGFVVTDYSSIYELVNHGMGNIADVSALSLKAGVDMDMMGDAFIKTLKQLLSEGRVTIGEIDLACRRVLEAKYKMGLFEDPYRQINEARAKREIGKPEHIKFAREIARSSMVLLKNSKGILPLKKQGTIAVVGPAAESVSEMIGTWAFFGNNSATVTPYRGIKEAVGGSGNVLYAKGANFTDDKMLSGAAQFTLLPGQQPPAKESANESQRLLNEAVGIASKADVIVAVLGEQAAWSGEAASRSEISLPDSQKNLLKALLETGKPVVLVLVNGRPLTLEWEDANVSAILEAWNPGSQGGAAIADILFGDYNPSGRLSMTFPKSVGQIPIYYNHKNTGRPFDAKNKFTSKYLDISNEPLYPFGYGLSYTSFEYGNLEISNSAPKGEDRVKISVSVKNTGNYTGEEVVQLYIRDVAASISRPVKELKNFSKISLKPGESDVVSFTLTTEDLKFYNSNLKYVWEPGEFIIYVGPNSRDLKSAKITWRKD